jgi:RNA polymerase sigma-70 factor (ECF subfamily)
LRNKSILAGISWSGTLVVPAGVTFNPNEEEAVAAFLARPSVENYSAVFRVLVPRVQAYFRVRGYDAAAAEDLAQEVMLVVYRESRRLRDKGAFYPWLFKISRNIMLQEYRRATRRPQTVEITEVGSSAGDPLARLQFAEWMKCLDDDERETVMLRYIDGLEYHEIADVLGIPIGTAQWRIFKAKKKLAALFGQGG